MASITVLIRVILYNTLKCYTAKTNSGESPVFQVQKLSDGHFLPTFLSLQYLHGCYVGEII